MTYIACLVGFFMDYFLQYFNPLLYKNISYLNGSLFYCVLMKRFCLFFLSVFFSFILLFWGSSFAFDSIESLTNEEKIALMLMPAFRKTSQSVIDTWAIKEIVWKYWFAGIILYWENLGDVEWSVRFIDFLQEANIAFYQSMNSFSVYWRNGNPFFFCFINISIEVNNCTFIVKRSPGF